jgi:hypothetical protein
MPQPHSTCRHPQGMSRACLRHAELGIGIGGRLLQLAPAPAVEGKGVVDKSLPLDQAQHQRRHPALRCGRGRLARVGQLHQLQRQACNGRVWASGKVAGVRQMALRQRGQASWRLPPSPTAITGPPPSPRSPPMSSSHPLPARAVQAAHSSSAPSKRRASGRVIEPPCCQGGW